jgi:hypothetical protein
MTIRFNPKKSPSLGAILLISISLILFLLFGLPIISHNQNNYLLLIIKIVLSLLIIGLLFWFWTGTYYTIDNNSIIIKSGPFSWTISIHDISNIRLNQNMVGGMIKPTLSWKCMEIDYGKNNTISITPEDQERFLKTLTEINNEINIKYFA